MNILSIQSHVSYGYVGNKLATYPLQALGFEVWPVNTIQFSNHTGYPSWKGDVFPSQHIRDVINGLFQRGLAAKCDAILSGYIGDKAIGEVILDTVQLFRQYHPKLIYLCDPVMGHLNHKKCFVKPDIPDFFRDHSLSLATIITPNHHEAEYLWNREINTRETLQQACDFFHAKGIHIVLITSLKLDVNDINPAKKTVFLSTKNAKWVASTPSITLDNPINGTGDLFSALYLAYFLLKQDPVDALQTTMNRVYEVIQMTQKAQQRELQIITPDYKHPPSNYVMLERF